MDTEQYLKDRLDDQISWYDNKSQWSQRWYRRFQLLQFGSASLIPFCIAVIPKGADWSHFLVALLGLVAAAAAAVLNLYKFHENWLQYRSTCEALKHEKHLFLTKATPYGQENAFALLVQRAEALMSKENVAWAQAMSTAGAGSWSEGTRCSGSISTGRRPVATAPAPRRRSSTGSPGIPSGPTCLTRRT